MRDIGSLVKTYNVDKKSNKYSKNDGKKYEFDFTQVSDWDPGEYIIRILPPHPEKAPKGWVRKDEHKLQRTLDTKSRISCGNNFGKPCAFCDLLAELKKTNAFDEVDDSVANALVDLEIKENYMLAITVFASERKEKYTGNDGKEYEKTVLSPGTKELGKILTVPIDRAKTLHKALVAIVKADPSCSQVDEEGSYLVLTKDKTYDIKHHDELRNVPLKRMDLMEKYPNLLKLQGKQVDEAAGEAMYESAWFWKHLQPYFES